MSILSELRSATNGNAMGRELRRLFKSSTVLSDSDKELASGYMSGANEFTIITPVKRYDDKSYMLPFELLGQVVEVTTSNMAAANRGTTRYYITDDQIEQVFANKNCKAVRYTNCFTIPIKDKAECGRTNVVHIWFTGQTDKYNVVTFRTRLTKTQLKNILTFTPYKLLRLFNELELADE